jgi:hypothetical protein
MGVVLAISPEPVLFPGIYGSGSDGAGNVSFAVVPVTPDAAEDDCRVLAFTAAGAGRTGRMNDGTRTATTIRTRKRAAAKVMPGIFLRRPAAGTSGKTCPVTTGSRPPQSGQKEYPMVFQCRVSG